MDNAAAWSRSLERRLTRLSLARVARGLLISPIVPCVITLAWRHFESLALVPYTYPAAIIGGVPVLLVYEMLGLRRLWHYIAGGFVLPFATTLVLLRTTFYEPGVGWTALAAYAGAWGVLFAAGTVTFWFIAIKPALLPRSPGVPTGDARH